VLCATAAAAHTGARKKIPPVPDSEEFCLSLPRSFLFFFSPLLGLVSQKGEKAKN
jgi:hypothetical protein